MWGAAGRGCHGIGCVGDIEIVPAVGEAMDDVMRACEEERADRGDP